MALLGSDTSGVEFYGNHTDTDGQIAKKAPLRIGNTLLYYNHAYTYNTSNPPVLQLNSTAAGTYQFVGIPGCMLNNKFGPWGYINNLAVALDGYDSQIEIASDSSNYTGFYSGTVDYSSQSGSFTVPLARPTGGDAYTSWNLAVLLTVKGNKNQMATISSYSQSNGILTVNYYIVRADSSAFSGTISYFIVKGVY